MNAPQLALPLGPAANTTGAPRRAPSAEERFRAFHAANPHVYAALARLARRAKAAGKERCGIKMLWEVARWELWLATTDHEFRLNNNYHSRMARLLMANEPDLAGFFETRKLHT